LDERHLEMRQAALADFKRMCVGVGVCVCGSKGESVGESV
jgi:hypothetical protein